MKRTFSTPPYVQRKTRLLYEAVAKVLAQEETVTIRRIHYALVTMALRDELGGLEYANTFLQYNRLMKHLTSYRNWGWIDWDAIIDTDRERKEPVIGESTREAAEDGVRYWFKLDRWAKQERRVELWTEKQGSAEMLEGLRVKYRLPFQANKGNASTTFMQSAARSLEAGTLLIYVGDHDPSGMDMDRNIKERLKLYKAERGIEFKRVALTMAQIEKFDLPPDYTKPNDSKGKAYKKKFGDKCWEVEALPVAIVLRDVEKAITAEIDQAEWDAVVAEERERRDEALAKLGKAKWLD